MVVIKIVRPPKIIDYHVQHQRTSVVIKVINSVVKSLLDSKDIVSYGTCKTILSACPSLTSLLEKVLSHDTIIHIFQAILNLGMCIIQYGYLSWFQYLLLTPSGLRMAFKLVFENPVYGVLWYFSLYFSAIRSTFDEKVFNRFADLIGIPHHDAFSYGLDFYRSLSSGLVMKFQGWINFDISTYSKTVDTAIDTLTVAMSQVTMKITEPLSGTKSTKNPKVYEDEEEPKKKSVSFLEEIQSFGDAAREDVKGLFSMKKEIVIPGETSPKVPIEALPVKTVKSHGDLVANTAKWLGDLLEKVFKKDDPNLNVPVYIPERDAIHHNDEEMVQHVLSIRNTREIKKLVKEMVPSSSKRHAHLRKEAKRMVTEVHTSSGQKVCIGKCERRVKTLSGNYCSSECGKTPAFGSRDWCWIEPASKGANTRDVYLGKPYDYCDAGRLSKGKMCFTGVDYEPCNL